MRPRELTAEELGALEFLLACDFPGVEELRLQAPHARVVDRCSCGCATIGFDVDSSRAPAAAVASRMPVEAESISEPMGLLLFVDDGYLSSMEIYTAGDEIARTFPPPSSFRPPQPSRT